MDTKRPLSSYDNIAAMYDLFWADWYLPAALPALEELFFSKLSAGSKVLDLCCGSGHVTKELAARGYAVTGLDLSSSLIEKAMRKVPSAQFLVQDARELQLQPKVHATLSTFDSLNHILTLADLQTVFTRVFAHLVKGGLFVFDMNDEQAYFADLRQWAGTVADNIVGLVRGAYDPATQTARTELISFQQQTNGDLWTQTRSVIEQRCYSQDEITAALLAAGFQNIQAIPATSAGVDSALGFGRTFYTAQA